MTKTYLAVVIVAAFALPVHAENWQTVDVTTGGAIMEIDVDSIKHYADGSARVMTSAGLGEYTMFFDCKGHYGMTANFLVHIPRMSIAEATSDIVCLLIPPQEEESVARKWGKRWGK